ncbi:hypothetical protein [Rhodoferax sp.]|uniref:hypothetical protein n=1 Tax=Rhodoferax sp. TaxID=50421 RepID=UPI002764D504|nr:hypothetical protein [Rhodoferax sp.]
MKCAHDEAIAFEAAKASIENWIAIRSDEISAERTKAAPDVERLNALNAEVSRLVRGRLSLRVNDHINIVHPVSTQRIKASGQKMRIRQTT